MQLRKRSQRRRDAGFTLMEVLLVLVILVILGSMAVGMFTGVQEQAEKDAARSQVATFKRQVQIYRQQLGQYPTSLQDLIVQPTNLSKPERWSKLLDVNEVPLDPWGNQYQFQAPGKINVDSFDVWSMGPDRASGSEDDIGNWPAAQVQQ
jgi:general secretion pathway protein G